MLEQNSVTPSLLADNKGRDYHFSKHCRYQIEIPKTVLCSDRGHIAIQKWSHIFIQTSLRQIRTVHAHYIYVITFCAVVYHHHHYFFFDTFVTCRSLSALFCHETGSI